MKHAYLIIAHNEYPILKRLISILDDVRNDIFILIDKKSEELYQRVLTIETKYSKLYAISNRIDIRWGDISQVEAEYLLFEQASSKGEYEYYHLLSGICLPIKSQDYIHDFFDKNRGQEFVNVSNVPSLRKNISNRVERYHIFTKNLRYSKPSFDYYTKRILRKLFLSLQKITRFKRHHNLTLSTGGSNWVSITNNFCQYMLSRRDETLKQLSHTLCSDEIFAQSLLCDFLKLPNTKHCNKNMREIDWQRGNPYTWEGEDLDYLKKSQMLFARKFSSEHLELVEAIVSFCDTNSYKQT